MQFSVAGVSETWLNRSNADLFNFPGYLFIANFRKHKSGGGVGLHFQTGLKYKPRTDLQSPNNSLYESIFVEIMQPPGKNVISGWLYECLYIQFIL